MNPGGNRPQKITKSKNREPMKYRFFFAANKYSIALKLCGMNSDTVYDINSDTVYVTVYVNSAIACKMTIC